MDSELDRTYSPFERNEEFERWLDDCDWDSPPCAKEDPKEETDELPRFE